MRPDQEYPIPSLPSAFLVLALLIITSLSGGCVDNIPKSDHTPKSTAVEAYQAARSALAAGRADSLELAEAAYQTDPDYPDAAWLYASLLGREGRYDDALVVCEHLVEESPDYVQAHILKGILWDRKGNRESANNAYDCALTVFSSAGASSRSQPLFRLYEAVTIFLRRGKLEGVRAINMVLERFPEYGPAKYVKKCMQDKNRAFLLRWFSERNDG